MKYTHASQQHQHASAYETHTLYKNVAFRIQHVTSMRAVYPHMFIEQIRFFLYTHIIYYVAWRETPNRLYALYTIDHVVWSDSFQLYAQNAYYLYGYRTNFTRRIFFYYFTYKNIEISPCEMKVLQKQLSFLCRYFLIFLLDIFYTRKIIFRASV